jgi:hypothetical protein
MQLRFLAVFGLSLIAQGATYYVDSATRRDSSSSKLAQPATRLGRIKNPSKRQLSLDLNITERHTPRM